MQQISRRRSAIVVGAGIVGLAIARALAMRNYEITVMERTPLATGASVRNFGMIWPIGQPAGELYERAILSKQIWKETCLQADIWYEEKGSLHLAYQRDEMSVLEEVMETYVDRNYKILRREAVADLSPAAITEGLAGGLFSPHEMVVNPKQAIDQLAKWLAEKYGVKFLRHTVATEIRYPSVMAGTTSYEADEIFVCSGTDFETLYPELFTQLPIAKCKLQMMRLQAQPDNWRIGPSLCGALSLLHYHSFRKAPSWSMLRERLEAEFPEYIRWGIHVMVSQNDAGELTVGDSHEYGSVHDPFDKNHINALILKYLAGFARFKDSELLETWHGVYPKLTNGDSHIVWPVQDGVTVVNGLGGAGMTLSFGLGEQLIRGMTGR